MNGLRKLGMPIPESRHLALVAMITLSAAITACEAQGELSWREICDRPVSTPDPEHPLFGGTTLIQYDRAIIDPKGSARDSDLIARARVAEVCTPRTTAIDGELPYSSEDLGSPYLYRPIRLEIVELLTDPGRPIDGLIVYEAVTEYRGFSVSGEFIHGFELGSEGIIFASWPSEGQSASTHFATIRSAATALTDPETLYEEAYPVNWYAIQGTRAVSRISDEDSDIPLDRLLEIIEGWGPAPAP